VRGFGHGALGSDALQLYSDDSRAAALCQRSPGRLPRATRYMPKVTKRLRNLGYRVPFLRRRFELEDILLVGVVIGGSFAVVLGWFVWVHWRIL